MKRTILVLSLVLVLTGCRYLEQTRHAAANAIADAVVRTVVDLQSSAPAGPSSRPLDRPAVRLAGLAWPAAAEHPLPAAAALPIARPAGVAAAKACRTPAPAVRRPLRSTGVQLCRTTEPVKLDENGNASM